MDRRTTHCAYLADRQRVGDVKQCRPSHTAALRHRRLLRRICSNPIAPTSCWPRRSACAPRASAASACGCSEGLAGLVAEQLRPQSSPTRPRIRASSTSARPARIPIARSSASPSSIAACCRACSSCRPPSRASSAPRTSRCWPRPPRQLAPDRQRGAHARDSSSRRRTSGLRRSRRTCGGAGIRT